VLTEVLITAVVVMGQVRKLPIPVQLPQATGLPIVKNSRWRIFTIPQQTQYDLHTQTMHIFLTVTTSYPFLEPDLLQKPPGTAQPGGNYVKGQWSKGAGE